MKKIKPTIKLLLLTIIIFLSIGTKKITSFETKVNSESLTNNNLYKTKKSIESNKFKTTDEYVKKTHDLRTIYFKIFKESVLEFKKKNLKYFHIKYENNKDLSLTHIYSYFLYKIDKNESEFINRISLTRDGIDSLLSIDGVLMPDENYQTAEDKELRTKYFSCGFAQEYICELHSIAKKNNFSALNILILFLKYSDGWIGEEMVEVLTDLFLTNPEMIINNWNIIKKNLDINVFKTGDYEKFEKIIKLYSLKSQESNNTSDNVKKNEICLFFTTVIIEGEKIIKSN